MRILGATLTSLFIQKIATKQGQINKNLISSSPLSLMLPRLESSYHEKEKRSGFAELHCQGPPSRRHNPHVLGATAAKELAAYVVDMQQIIMTLTLEKD